MSELSKLSFVTEFWLGWKTELDGVRVTRTKFCQGIKTHEWNGESI